uniref:Uncharacterized protein n=1 Tax=Globisporangium ultimum (strain ATCC 200006 / CBS 805.95 / DAOM BR144) TaxID=431595 RepID=K3WJH2_GLOUD
MAITAHATTSTQRASSDHAPTLPRLSRRRSQPLVDAEDISALIKPTQVRRAKSYPDGTASSERLYHRVRIEYHDEGLRLRAQENAKRLIQSAVGNGDNEPHITSSNNAILARKALKYRNVLGRASCADVNDPTFDANKFMGVDWCKVSPTTEVVARCTPVEAPVV